MSTKLPIFWANSHRPKTVRVHFPNQNTPGHLYFGLASHKTTTSWLFLICGQSGVYAKVVMLGMNLLGWIYFFFSRTCRIADNPWQATVTWTPLTRNRKMTTTGVNSQTLLIRARAVWNWLQITNLDLRLSDLRQAGLILYQLAVRGILKNKYFIWNGIMNK